jgi:hypothetical protein
MVGGYDFIIDRDLLYRTQPLTIDFTHLGFRVTSHAAPSGFPACYAKR